MNDIGSYRKIVLPSPRLFTRMIEERTRQQARAVEDAARRVEAAIEDALFDEAIDRQIKEIAA